MFAAINFVFPPEAYVSIGLLFALLAFLAVFVPYGLVRMWLEERSCDRDRAKR
jgi:hypothetical protein